MVKERVVGWGDLLRMEHEAVSRTAGGGWAKF